MSGKKSKIPTISILYFRTPNIGFSEEFVIDLYLTGYINWIYSNSTQYFYFYSA